MNRKPSGLRIGVTRERLRKALPYLVLAAAFACAWVADRAPNLFFLAVGAAILIVTTQAAILGTTKGLNRESSRQEDATDSRASLLMHAIEASVPSAASDVSNSVTSGAMQLVDAAVWHSLLLDSRNSMRPFNEYRNLLPHLQRLKKLQREDLGVWSFPMYLEPTEMGLTIKASELRVALAGCLATWQVLDLGSDTFNVDAGAFTIGHIRGATVIRIRDNSKVTVERADHVEKEAFGLNEFSDLAETTMRSTTRGYSAHEFKREFSQ